MLAIDLGEEDRGIGTELERRFPDSVTTVDGRAVDGTFTHWTLFLSAAALAVPEVRRIIVELIQAKKHKSVSMKGVKYQGYSAEEIEKIMSALDKLKDKP